MSAWVYILANRPRGTIYIGVTSALVQRIWQHKTHVVEGFTKRYGVDQLVHFEAHATMPLAIQREHTMKHWQRQWKVELIEATNPKWEDLYTSLTR